MSKLALVLGSRAAVPPPRSAPLARRRAARLAVDALLLAAACGRPATITSRWIDARASIELPVLGLGLYSNRLQDQNGVFAQFNGSIAFDPEFTAARSGADPPTGTVETRGYSLNVGPTFAVTSWLTVYAGGGFGERERCVQFFDASRTTSPIGFYSVCESSLQGSWTVGALLHLLDAPGPTIDLGYDGFFGGFAIGLGVSF